MEKLKDSGYYIKKIDHWIVSGATISHFEPLSFDSDEQLEASDLRFDEVRRWKEFWWKAKKWIPEKDPWLCKGPTQISGYDVYKKLNHENWRYHIWSRLYASAFQQTRHRENADFNLIRLVIENGGVMIWYLKETFIYH